MLLIAIRGQHAEIVELLWPYCKAERHHRYLETAISLGFHRIADFLVGTQAFEYRHSPSSDIELLIKDGFERPVFTAFQQWERFIFVRRSEKLNLHRVFFDYALLLATKADDNAGLRLVRLLLEGEKPLADVNCKINIDAEVETPLTNAAEKGNLEILDMLIERPDISLKICGRYKWPAFLHLLASSKSIDSEKGRAIARKLAKESLPDSILVDKKEARLQTVFKNVLRLGDDALVKQVINLVQGAAGIYILPLLIRVNETAGLKWVLNDEIQNSTKPPPILWVLLCDFFKCYPSSAALETFIWVGEKLVEKAIWDRMILVCLNSRNFCFVKQFFYPLTEIPPREVTEETVAGFPQASTDLSLIREWVDKGYANAALWSAFRSGGWKTSAFESFLSCSHIDLDQPFPLEKDSNAAEDIMLSSPLSDNSTGEKRKFPFMPPTPQNQQDYQMQLMLLEKQNKLRLMNARNEQMGIKTEKLNLAWTWRGSPLAWASANRNVELVEALLRSSRVKVNSQDPQKRTPLMHAIAANHWQTVEKLLNVGDIDLNLQDNEGRTAIFHAAQWGDLHIIQMLTQTKKVDFSIRDCYKKSVHDIAKMKGKQDVVAALAL
jgi:ankyrin repeat protein